jgi:hypothetical protein
MTTPPGSPRSSPLPRHSTRSRPETSTSGSCCRGPRSATPRDREETFFLNVDSVSYGFLRYVASEGAVVSYPMDRRLLELCGAVANAEAGFGAQPIRISAHTDALPARARGLRATSILSLEDGLPPPYYHTPQDTPDKLDAEAMTRAVEFTLALVRALDRDAGRVEAVAREPAGQV